MQRRQPRMTRLASKTIVSFATRWLLSSTSGRAEVGHGHDREAERGICGGAATNVRRQTTTQERTRHVSGRIRKQRDIDPLNIKKIVAKNDLP